MIPFSQQAVEELILPCISSTPVTAVTLFPEHFTRPFSVVHDKIFEILDNDKVRLAAIAAPRGFGKTTTVALGFIGRKVLFREVHYIVYISSTVTEAAAKVKTLARELQENQLIRELFGDLKGVKWAEGSGEIELSDANGPFCYIQAKGAGSQIRGLKWGKYRPDIFLLDDLEDPEEVLNEVLRAKLKEWFFADVLGAMDQASDSKTRLFLIGTVLHEDSLLANLIEEGESDDEEVLEPGVREQLKKENFVTLRLEACDDEFNSVWPEYLSSSELKAKAHAYEKRGLLDVFYREWRNIVIAKDTASFQKSMFRYFVPGSSEVKSCERIVIIDPAKTATPTSAFSAILGVGFSATLNRIYQLACVNERITYESMFEKAFDMADELGTSVVGVESTGLGDWIMYPIQQFANRRKKFYQIVELKATKQKDLRVAAMVPFYKIGAVYHHPDLKVRGPLEQQLLSFPRSKFWDVMDCFANFIEMFNLGNRAFTTEYDSAEIEMCRTNNEDEYEMLRREDRAERPLKRQSLC